MNQAPFGVCRVAPVTETLSPCLLFQVYLIFAVLNAESVGTGKSTVHTVTESALARSPVPLKFAGPGAKRINFGYTSFGCIIFPSQTKRSVERRVLLRGASHQQDFEVSVEGARVLFSAIT